MKKIAAKEKFALFPKKRLFDSHCHLDLIPGHKKKIIEEAIAAGVSTIVTVGTDLKTSKEGLKLKKDFPETVLAGIGLHPELLIPGSDLFSAGMHSDAVNQALDDMQKLLLKGGFDLIGECGLDYYWLMKNESISPAERDKSMALQELLLAGQLRLARLFNLPVSLHSRATVKECLEILAPYQAKLEVVFHSFTGTLSEAEQILASGYKLGINGIITYKSAQDLREIMKKVIGTKKVTTPEELYDAGFFLETDAPLLFPGNSRTREEHNSPKQLPYIWEFVYNYLNKPS